MSCGREETLGKTERGEADETKPCRVFSATETFTHVDIIIFLIFKATSTNHETEQVGSLGWSFWDAHV